MGYARRAAGPHEGRSGGPALETETAVGEVCAIPVGRFPFACFSCHEEMTDESEVRLTEGLQI